MKDEKKYIFKDLRTCKRIISEFDLTDFEQRNPNQKAVSEEELQKCMTCQILMKRFSTKSTQIKEQKYRREIFTRRRF